MLGLEGEVAGRPFLLGGGRGGSVCEERRLRCVCVSGVLRVCEFTAGAAAILACLLKLTALTSSSSVSPPPLLPLVIITTFPGGGVVPPCPEATTAANPTAEEAGEGVRCRW